MRMEAARQDGPGCGWRLRVRKRQSGMKQTRVYTASVDCLKDPVLYRKALTLLPEQRVEKAERMKPESGKRLSAGAGLLLLASLADYLTGAGGGDRIPAELQALRFAEGTYGKPYLPDCPEVHFNLSHSGNHAMCIVSPNPVGCDIEQVDRRQKQIDMVIRCLAESEQRLAAVSAVHFYRIWTLKESILKLSGKGLQISLKSFEISLDPLSVRQTFLREPVKLREYDTLRCDGGEKGEYCCSCASAGGDLPEEMIRVDLEDVLTRTDAG